MGTLLFGLAVGLAVGYVLGRRAAGGAVGGAAPPAGAPIATPNKRGRKAGLTEEDFRPGDDILERMRRAWEAGADQLDEPEEGSEEGNDEMAPQPTTTVTEILVQLAAEGYGDDLRFSAGEVICGACGEIHGTDDVEVDHVLRHEGPSDPADETIVFGLRCPRCGAKGSIVSAFGPDADPALADAFVYWSAKARHR